MTVSERDRVFVEQLLGREARGLKAIAVRDNQGLPMVVRVASLVDAKPFPTMFWLIDKRINYAIDYVEARGLIAQFQSLVDQSLALQQQMILDHKAYIALRQSYESPEDKSQIQALGFDAVSSTRGIGGISDYQRIRCLHTYYAAHLVSSNSIGQLLDDYWQKQGVTFPHLD